MSASLELQADALQFGNLASISKHVSNRSGYLALLLAEMGLHRNWPTVFREMSLRVHLNDKSLIKLSSVLDLASFYP